MKYVSSKTYGHEIGLSCAFRQWKAESHCNKLHGYALAFRFEFQSADLNGQDCVVDFGGLKSLKQQLEALFDHKTLVARDDPQIPLFREMHGVGVLDLVEVSAVGCEKFAELAWSMAERWLQDQGMSARVKVRAVEVREHGANSAQVIEA